MYINGDNSDEMLHINATAETDHQAFMAIALDSNPLIAEQFASGQRRF